MNQQCFASNILFKTFLIFTLSGITAAVNAATYYINNSNPPGVQCNNNGSGTTMTTPWCDIYKVNSVNFEPGDVINLARGSTWIITTPNDSAIESGKGMIFDESDNGSATGNVTIQAYGNPLFNPPRITTAITSLPKPKSEQVPYRGIVLNNAAHWVIKDLEISHVAVGIFFYYTERSFQNISLSDLKLHHIYGYEKYDPENKENIEFSSGILFRSVNTLQQDVGDDPIIKDVSIDNVEGYRNQSTINFSLGKRCEENEVGCTGGTDKASAASNIVLNHLHIYDNDADKQSDGCYESVRLVRMKNAVLMNSIVERAGGCKTLSGTTAVILGHTSNVKIINNIIRNTMFTGSQDESAVDMEVANGAVQIHGNLFAGNQMGTECMAIYAREWCKFTITSNSYMLNRKAAMFINGDEHQEAPNQTKHLSVGDFKYNLHYALPGSHLKRQQPDQTATTHDLFSEVTTTDPDGNETNVKLLNATDFYSAAADFGDADVSDLKNWSYEWFDGNTWQPMIYNTQYQAWHRANNNAPYATATEMKPAPGAFVARVWTAPKAGTISIVGRIAKSATLNHLGNGVYARIDKNNFPVWPIGGPNSYETLAFNDMVGKDTNVFNLSVQANDKIRFGVAAINGDDLGDIISWAPMIAYTAVPEGVAGASIVWEFNTPGWIEFWGKFESPSDAYQMKVRAPYDALNGNMEGALKLDIEGTNPYIRSRLTITEDEAIDGSIYRYVTIRLKHNSNANRAKLSWITSGSLSTWTDPALGGPRVKEINLQTTDEYQELTVDMGDMPEWTNNKIWQLRLDPIDNPTNLPSDAYVYLDYIRLDQAAP